MAANSSSVMRLTLLHWAVQALSWLLIAAGAISFSFFYSTIPTRWYNVRATELIAWRNTLILQYEFANTTTGRSTPLLSGSQSFMLIWQWCGTLAVALGSAGLLWLSSVTSKASLPSSSTSSPHGQLGDLKPSVSREGGNCWSLTSSTKKALKRFRRLFSYQVAPRGVWTALLGPGGLSLLDLLLVLLWFGLHIMWLHEMTMRVLDNRRTAPPPPKPVIRQPPAMKSPSSSASGSGTANHQPPMLSSTPKTSPPPLPIEPAAVNGTTTVNGIARQLLQTTTSVPATLNVSDSSSSSPSAAAAPKPSSVPPPAKAMAPPPPAKKLKALPVVVQDSVAKYFGWVARLDILLLFFPLPRCNFLHWLLASDFATLIKYHRWLGVGTLLMYSLHGIIYMSIWTRDGILSTMLDWDMSAGVNRLSGLVAICGGWMLGVTSIPFVRRKLFNLFHVCHIFGAIIFMLFAFMHRKDVATWVMPGVFLYLLDVVLRTIQQNFNCVRLVAHVAADNGCQVTGDKAEYGTAPVTTLRTAASGAAIARISSAGGVLSLSIPCHESLRWVGSETVFLNSPAVSWWQWHPFTIASASAAANFNSGSENRMEIRIKKYNKWSRALISRLSSKPDCPISLYVSGPYSDVNHKWITDFDTHVFVAGGIGVTPALGMISELINFRRRTAATSRVILIWVSRTMDELQALPYEILQEASSGTKGSSAWLELRLYLTAPTTDVKSLTLTYIADGDVADVNSKKAIVQVQQGTESCCPASPATRSSGDYTPPASPHQRVTPPSGPGVPASASAETTLQGMDVMNCRPLSHPYMFSPLLWMAASVLSFGGGFAGLMCAQAYDAHIARTVAKRQDFSYVGMLQFAALGLGAALPPAVLMLAVHLHRRLSRVSTWYSGSETNSTTGKCNSSNGTATTPGVAVTSSPTLTLESYVLNGRPDLASLLHQIAKSGNLDSTTPSMPWSLSESNSSSQSEWMTSPSTGSIEETRVAVYAAGPAPLVNNAIGLCASINGVWGRKGRAYLDFRALTHDL